MNATARKSITRQITNTLRGVMALPKAALYHLLNGAAIQHLLDNGDLVTVNTILDERGAGPELLDGHRSWAGRSIAAAYRKTNHREPLKAWVQHRASNRWIFANVYVPGDAAINDGLTRYVRTMHLVPAARQLAEVAQTDSRRWIEVWDEGRGLHLELADEQRREPSAFDWADGDNPNPNWDDWHGLDEPPCY